MAYQLIDLEGNDVAQHDLQDKGMWCQIGATKEEVFVDKFGEGLNLIINPEKEHNPYVPDMTNISTKLLADLKTQNTPFFQAQSRFGLDPQYTVVFNEKDRKRYKQKYPNIEIYFAIDWQIVKFVGKKVIEVQPMQGVWYIPFIELQKKIALAPLHSYQQRKNDRKGNAKCSYVLDLREPEFVRLI